MPATITVGELVKEFPGKKFLSKHIKFVGKILKNEGDEAAREYLRNTNESTGNFKPPVKSNIIAKSRDFSEWPIVKVSGAVQKYIYSLSNSEFKALNPGTSSATLKAWFEQNGVDMFGYTSVQGLNLIFSNAKATYEGALLKVKNRNAKKKKNLEYINKKRYENGEKLEEFVEEKVFDDTEHLLQPPGVNQTILCYQGVHLKPVSKKDISLLPQDYTNYSRDKDFVISIGKVDRLAIPYGEPGYIPDYHRAFLKRCGRIRNRASGPDDSILYKISIGDDWLIFDGRSLLRNVLWRRLVSKTDKITINGLIDFFSGDPVININNNIITLSYKEGVVPIFSRANPIRGKRTKEILEELTIKTKVVLLSCDVGQINPLAVRMSTISKTDNGLKAELISQDILPDNLLNELAGYRSAIDEMEELFKKQTLKAISEEYRAEFTAISSITPDMAKDIVCAKLRLDKAKVPWEDMNDQSQILASLVKKTGGDITLVTFIPEYKKEKKSNKNKAVNRKDVSVKRELLPKVSDQARKAYQDKLWELKRESARYDALTKRKNDFFRRCANYIMNRAIKFAPDKEIVVNLEDLSDKKIMHGRGKRVVAGWDGFFSYKKENRWVMVGIHKALLEMGPNKGIVVFYPIHMQRVLRVLNAIILILETVMAKNLFARNVHIKVILI